VWSLFLLDAIIVGLGGWRISIIHTNSLLVREGKRGGTVISNVFQNDFYNLTGGGNHKKLLLG
jgi:hypothetical protein